MASSVLLGKRLRRQVRAKVWPILEAAGFVEFAPLRAYRVSEGRVEVVEISPFRAEWRGPRWLGGEAYANGACFSLYVGTYAHDGTQGEARPRYHECHWCTKLHHGDNDSAGDGRSFHGGLRGERLEAAVEAAVAAIRERGLDVLKGHGAESPRHEEVGLSSDEADEMLRICREGRSARSGVLDRFHRGVHLADERLVA